MKVNIFQFNELKESIPNIGFDKLKLIKALEKEFNQEIDLNLVFVGLKQIGELNAKYLHRNNDTDVISFNIDSKTSEVYICPQFIKKNSKNDLAREVLRAIIHGILHVEGYDHKNYYKDGSVEKMFVQQEKILKRICSTLEI